MGKLVRARRSVRVKDELDDARAVAQVDEDQAAVVTAAMHPACHPRVRAGPFGGQLLTPGVAEVVGGDSMPHDKRLPRRMVGITSAGPRSRCSPDSMFFRDVIASGSFT